MKQYETKQELIGTIQQKYQNYREEFDTIPEALRHTRMEATEKTPAENLSYQLGWLNLLLQWEQDECAKKEVHTPAVGYKWNNLGGLYQTFYQTYEKGSLKEQLEELDEAVDKLCLWVNTLSDQELFEPRQRKWATTKAAWPIWKWVHINSVAPFTNFRTKIRKWKKLAAEKQ